MILDASAASRDAVRACGRCRGRGRGRGHCRGRVRARSTQLVAQRLHHQVVLERQAATARVGQPDLAPVGIERGEALYVDATGATQRLEQVERCQRPYGRRMEQLTAKRR